MQKKKKNDTSERDLDNMLSGRGYSDTDLEIYEQIECRRGRMLEYKARRDERL